MMYPDWIHDVSNLDTSCIQIENMMYPILIHDVSNLDNSGLPNMLTVALGNKMLTATRGNMKSYGG